MKYDVVFGALVVGTIVLWWLKGFRMAAASAIVVTTALLPMSVLGRTTTPHVGIAAAVPVIYDYTLFLVAAGVVVALSDKARLRGLLLWLPLIGWLVLCRVLWWSGTPEETAGLLQYGQAILAFGVGAALGPWRESEDPHPRLVVGIALVQVAAVALGSIGLLHLNPSGPQPADLVGRAFGTLGHPDQLAKTLAVGLAVMLAGAAALTQRRLMVVGVLATLSGVALTQGRAAFGGAIAVMLVWALLQPRAGGLRRRAGVFLLLLVVVLGVSASSFQERFAEDPSGGARGQLTAVATKAIRARPLSGTGPNAYVTVVGRTDELTATGVPVHNAFLLSAGELGIAGGVLLFLPLVALWLAAWRRRRLDGSVGFQARACLGLVPLTLLVGWTGWGLLETSVFVFFTYICGYFWGNITAQPAEPDVTLAEAVRVA